MSGEGVELARPGCGRRTYRRLTCLHFKRTYVNATIHHAIETGPTLIEERRWRETGIAGVNGWAADRRSISQGRAAIVSQRTEQRVGIDLVPGSGQKAWVVITAENVPANDANRREWKR